MIIDLELHCRSCPLKQRPYVPSESGAPRPVVMAIGLAPGVSEEQMRRPFVGDVGSIVRETLGGIVGDAVYYTNLIKRRPVDDDGNQRKPTNFECMHCGNCHLVEELESFKPPIVVTFGQLATAFIVGKDVKMNIVHGLPLIVSRFSYDFTLIPTYDVGYVMRRGGLMSKTGSTWLDDLQELRKLVEAD